MRTYQIIYISLLLPHIKVYLKAIIYVKLVNTEKAAVVSLQLFENKIVPRVQTGFAS